MTDKDSDILQAEAAPELKIEPLLENRFLKAYDLQYAPGKHYFEASRRSRDGLVAAMDDNKFRSMLPDAVTCAVIIDPADDETGENARLLLSYEYRYPCGRFLLSPPAGLIDPEDADTGKAEDAVLRAAEREIMEETGLGIDRERGDRLFVLSPVLFSSPGMTDESNAIACAVIRSCPDDVNISYDGITGTEKFEGSVLLGRDQARKILDSGRDVKGKYYSTYTALVLLYFISGMWKNY